jgi:two-component system, OmpR family, sensor histidine kinase KdpD
MTRPQLLRLLRSVGVALASLAAATGAASVLEGGFGLADASIVYLPAVIATALVVGTVGAAGFAVVAILVYDYLFTQPLHTLAINDPQEWLSLALLLLVAVIVGELTTLQRTRAELARTRERAAQALFRVSRALATRTSTEAALGEIADILRVEGGFSGVWFTLGSDDAAERPVTPIPSADGGLGGGSPTAAPHRALVRAPGEQPARWVRVHPPSRMAARRSSLDLLRARITVGEVAFGSIWLQYAGASLDPDRTTTRLVSATADQVGQAIAQDRLSGEAHAAAIAKESDALKSALLQSVSHDFRTPLSTIRAAVGTLRTEPLGQPQGEAIEAIDREVAYLDRLVANLLDLSRIEAGVLQADREVFDLGDLVERTLDRFGPALGERPVTVDISDGLVEADGPFVDAILANLVENVVRHTPPATALLIRGRVDDGRLELRVEDAGPGVAEGDLGRLFEKFYRVHGGRSARREGLGIGLAVVRGLAEATGGSVAADRSELGGLAVILQLPRPSTRSVAPGLAAVAG